MDAQMASFVGDFRSIYFRGCAISRMLHSITVIYTDYWRRAIWLYHQQRN